MGYALMNPNQSIKVEYRVRVNTSLVATKFLLRCDMPFRGSEESLNSLFKGPFLELVDTLKEINLEIASVINCASRNNLMTAPKIQKNLAAACAYEITQQIICDIADDVFSVLIDESDDIAGKEQMTVVVRYVNNEGLVKEMFNDITHKDVSIFFAKVNMLVNFIGSSNKRQELLRKKQETQFAKLIEEGQIETGSGLNQKSSIARAGDTRWGSHFRTLTSLMTLYGAIIWVLEVFENDTSFEKYGETIILLDLLQSFDFIVILYMMVEILGFTI
ncbi:uncharacterized protein LOC131649810 [Vicia villosa]|uniref:uncharacterized protein LOC131649810 n=1 Tax=Vicia villosa TaxID=3911 RepID=UPI00273B2225|nr:uncharacterized protein LOC131649810 [Vicia villosa]